MTLAKRLRFKTVPALGAASVAAIAVASMQYSQLKAVLPGYLLLCLLLIGVSAIDPRRGKPRAFWLGFIMVAGYHVIVSQGTRLIDLNWWWEFSVAPFIPYLVKLHVLPQAASALTWAFFVTLLSVVGGYLAGSIYARVHPEP